MAFCCRNRFEYEYSELFIPTSMNNSQFLNISLQSCHQSQVLEGVLSRVQLDPSVSRQAAMLRQRKIITETDFLNDASSRLLASNSNHLFECEVTFVVFVGLNSFLQHSCLIFHSFASS